MDKDLDERVKSEVYRFFAEEGRPPVAAEVAVVLERAPIEIERSFRRLHDDHILVLAPGTPYIWLANPFSGLPSPFRVRADDRDRWAICIWDALGTIALLGGTGTVDASCPDCGTPLEVRVDDGKLVPSTHVVHFSVPAARFWDDIGFT